MLIRSRDFNERASQYVFLLNIIWLSVIFSIFSKSFLDVKTTNFDREVQFMNQWMTDSQKLVNSLHVEMDPKEVTRTVQQIKVGLLCKSISK